MVSYDSQLKLRQDFTSDREKILKAITASVSTSPAPPPDLSGRPSLGRYLDGDGAKKAGTPDRAIEVLGARPRAPARREVDRFLRVGSRQHAVGGITGSVASESKDFGDMIYSLARARANMFTLDVADADYHSLEGYLKQVAEFTGGKYMKTNNFPALAMDLVRRAISGRYVLVVVKPRGTRGDHTIEVELVGKKGLVYARQFYQD